MFDGFFEALARVVAFFYSLTGDYAASIALLTVSILIVFTPISVRGARSMSKMSQLQPLMKKIQAQHKGDRFKAQEEMSKLYRQYSVKPLSGCLPLLLQLPVFFMLYQVIRGLSDTGGGETPRCAPKYIGEDSQLYQDLVAADCEMRWLGGALEMDLARSANTVIQESFVDALPYLGLVAVMVVLAWLQQYQAKVRRQTVGTNPQMEMVMKFMPFMLPVFSFIVQSGLTIYFGVSSLYRLAQQEYIHRTTKQIDLDAGPLVSEPEPPKPVTNERSRKAIEADEQRRAERARRSAARRDGDGHGGGARQADRKPPAELPPATTNSDAKLTPPPEPSGSQNEESEGKDDNVSTESASVAEASAQPTAETGTRRRSLFGRSREPKAEPEQFKPIESRRTSGDGRRRNTRKKK